jgi:hypothetical protein
VFPTTASIDEVAVTPVLTLFAILEDPVETVVMKKAPNDTLVITESPYIP